MTTPHHLFNKTATVTEGSYQQTSIGESVWTPTGGAQEINCAVQMDLSGEQFQYDREHGVQSARMFFDPSVSIAPKSIVAIDSVQWNVVGHATDETGRGVFHVVTIERDTT